MERTLHQQLKHRYGPETGGRSEVVVGAYRVDAVSADGRLIEVQSGPLSLLRPKLEWLLPDWRVDVIKPVVVARRLIRRDRSDGADLGSRRSPKRGTLLDVFDELVGLARVFPHDNLGIDILAVEVDEVRVSRRRRPGYQVVDRRLNEVVQTVRLRVAGDLWSLLPEGLPNRFTTSDLAAHLARPMAFAQRVAYSLMHSGAAAVVEKRGRCRVFGRVT